MAKQTEKETVKVAKLTEVEGRQIKICRDNWKNKVLSRLL